MTVGAGTQRASALDIVQTRAQRLLSGWVGPGLLAAAALLLRLYQLGRNPMWFDELFEYQVSLADPATIFRLAWFEPWPPLYHYLIKLTSGDGLIHAEWAWRYLSVAAGMLAVAGLFWLVRELAGPGPALLTAGLLALSPTQVYFSQEARAYMLMLLVVIVSTISVWQLWRSPGQAGGPDRRWRWALWVGLSLVGLYLSYAYCLVWLMQAAYLLWIERARRPALIAVGLTALGFSPLLYWIKINAAGKLAEAQATTWLTLPFLARMAFGGDPNRYGLDGSQVVLAVLLGGLALVGVLSALRARASSFERYLALQTILPLAGFFGLADGLLHLHLPSFQARQFIVLFPAFYGLVGLGWQWLFSQRPAAVARPLSAALWIVAALACLPGLHRYWTMTKSPEGDLALALRREAQPGDSVVSLHYSLDAALSFYAAPGVRVFTKPLAGAAGYAFSDSLSVLYTAQITRPYHLSDIYQSRQTWVVARQGASSAVVAQLVKGCVLRATEDYPPFQILRLTNCSV